VFRARVVLVAAIAAMAASSALAAPGPGNPGHDSAKHAGKADASAAPAAAPAPQPAPAAAPAAPTDKQKKTKPDSPGQTKRAVQQPAPAPAAAPVATVAAAPAVAPTVSAAPVVPAAPAPTPAAAKPKHQATARLVAVARPQAVRPATVVPAVAVARTAPPAVASRRHRAPSPTAKRPVRHPQVSQPSSPLIRNVEHILKVVPGWVRVALAALVAAGLLLLAGALHQALRAHRLERDRRRLAADVGLLQSALLPALADEVGRARVSTAYRPADGLAAGGDFFDVFALADGRTALILGDMAGHGREIVPFTALVRYSLRAYLEAGLAPRVALQVASTVLESQLGGHMVAAAVAVFAPDTGRLTYACAGQAPPLLAPAFPPSVMAVSSPPIGAGAVTGRRQTTVALPPGSAACFCTDGVADVRVADRRMGPDAVAGRFAALGAEAGADELLREVVRASDSQPDDMAVCVLAPLPGAAEPAPEVVEELELDAELLADGRATRFLAACSVEPVAAAAALRAAAELVARRGSAVLVVRRTATGASVGVDRPRAAILPIGRPPAAPAPGRAALAG
jgi:hypothetical protein